MVLHHFHEAKLCYLHECPAPGSEIEKKYRKIINKLTFLKVFAEEHVSVQRKSNNMGRKERSRMLTKMNSY